jgi:apolipoprotein N-acyltransferase
VVCATSGLTQLIDSHGNRRAQLPLLRDGVLETTLHLRHELTFFTRFGWLFPWLVCGLAVLGAIGVVWRGRRTGAPTVPDCHPPPNRGGVPACSS